MIKTELELLDEASNSAVVQLRGRRFPGIVIQGDSLHVLAAAARRLESSLERGNLEGASEDATELVELLTGYEQAYEQALAREGLALPYART